MTAITEKIECEVELDKTTVEFIDQLAARRSCDRDAIIGEAVGMFIAKFRDLAEKHAQSKSTKGDSRTGHTVVSPPKRNE